MNPENGMQVQIRELTEKDDPAIERVIRSCLVEFGADHPGTAWEDPFLGRLSQVYTGPSSAIGWRWTHRGRSSAALGSARFPDARSFASFRKCIACRGRVQPARRTG